MATPFDPYRLPTNPFNIYNDAATNQEPQGSNLPRGGCNFVDLTPGAGGSRCGCRRFWTRQTLGSPAPAPQGWCMCNHHACYHDDKILDDVSARPIPAGAGQENEKPKPMREPLSPMVDVQQQIPTSIPGLGFPSFGGGNTGQPVTVAYDRQNDMNNNMQFPFPPQNHQAPSLPDTINWGEFVQTQADPSGMPPIPPQCLLPSQTASTASSVQAKYIRPFAGKGLNTLTNGSPLKSTYNGTQLNTKQQRHPLAIQQDNQDTTMIIDHHHHHHHRPSTPMTANNTTQPETRTMEKGGFVPRDAMMKNIADAVSGHEQRLDRLETVSFSGVAHEDCGDKHDHLDLRVTEIEGKLEELEKTVNDDAATSRRGDRNDDATTQSVISVATDATTRPTHSHELFLSQIQTLQAQVSHLQSSLPSHNNPWEVEVVFLPFPLKRLWQDMNQFKSDPNGSHDEWTQLPMTLSSATMRSQSPLFGDWANPDHESEWLMPKACGDKSATDRRLRSRGLIQTVSVKGSDARSVQVAINAAFASVFQEMQMYPRRHETDTRLAKFHGLQSSWIPLRKIHKDSRLRFLSPAEMITPAVWDVPFLNSVMMRSSEPRLFVTQPDAYLQDFSAFESGWTWQRVRQLTRLYPDEKESTEVPEADALEDHWAWNEHLDEPPNVNTSMNLRQRRRMSRSPSHVHFPRIERWRSQSPAVINGNIPLLSNNRSSFPPHIRTMSMPAVAAARPSPVENYRHLASHNLSRKSSPAVRVAPNGGIMKNRGTRSPSHARFTPRWTASPSPMPWGQQDRQPTRGITPFAYATPYSNAPMQEVRGQRSGSVVRFDAHTQYYNNQSHPPPHYENAGPEVEDEEEDDDDDDDVEIKIYESDSDYGGISNASIPMIPEAELKAQLDAQAQQQQQQQSADEPWPGIEDQIQMSDAENIHPDVMDHRSQASSQPSEYPSTQRIWPETANEFQIHEDGR